VICTIIMRTLFLAIMETGTLNDIKVGNALLFLKPYDM